MPVAFWAFNLDAAPPTLVLKDVTSAAVDSGNVTVAKPTGTASGDFLVAIQWNDADGTEVAMTASGWTLAGSAHFQSGVGRGKVWYKTAGIEGANYVFGGHASSTNMVAVLCFDTHDTGTPFNVLPTWSGGASSVSHVAPSIDPTVAGAYAVYSVACIVTGSTGSYTWPAGTTEMEDWEPPGLWMDASLAVEQRADDSATGTRTATHSDARAFMSVSFAIAPEQESGGTDPKAGSDTGTLTEGTAGLQSASSRVDTATLGDVAALARSSAGSDSGTLSEAAQLVASESKSASDSLGLTGEVAVRLEQSDKTGSDSHSLTVETSAVQVTGSRSDTATLTESVSVVITSAQADSIALSDSSQLSAGNFVSGLDSATLSESSAVLNVGQSRLDTGTFSESLSLGRQSSVTDSVSLTGEVANVARTQQVAASDSSVLSESSTFSATVSAFDSATVSEQSEGQGNATKVGADSFSLVESAIVVVTVVAQDSLALTDTSTRLVAVAVADLVSLTEAHTLSVLSARVDAFALSESTDLLRMETKTANDSFALVDANSSSLTSVVGGPWPITATLPQEVRTNFGSAVVASTDYGSVTVTQPFLVADPREE